MGSEINLTDCNFRNAINGVQAVEIYKKELNKRCRCSDRAFNLVIMDLQVPDGLEASEKIINMAKNKVECNIIAITSEVNI